MLRKGKDRRKKGKKNGQEESIKRRYTSLFMGKTGSRDGTGGGRR